MRRVNLRNVVLLRNLPCQPYTQVRDSRLPTGVRGGSAGEKYNRAAFELLEGGA